MTLHTKLSLPISYFLGTSGVRDGKTDVENIEFELQNTSERVKYMSSF